MYEGLGQILLWCLRSIVPHGVKGILLVDQDLLVDFFLRNGFVEKSNVAVLSSRHFAALPHAPKVPIYFLHGSGKHVVSLQKKISMLPIGWRTEDLQTHPNFQEVINKDRLPVDLLSPSELLEATAYAIKNRCTILEYFSKES